MTRENRPSFSLGRPALALAMLTLIAAAVLLVSPTARASAGELWRQIGAFVLIDRSNDSRTAEPAGAAAEPTAEPFNGAAIASAASADDASIEAGFAVLAPTSLPAGYAQVGQWSVMPQAGGVNVFASFQADGGSHFLTLNQYRYGPQDRFDSSSGQNETVTDVTVRGAAGVWITGRLMANPLREPMPGEGELLETGWLLWDEQGVVYTLASDALSLEEMLAVAESLK